MSGSQMAGRTFCFVCRQVKWTSNVFLFAFETLQGYICTRSVYSSTMVRTTYSLPVFWFYGHYLNGFFLSFHVKQTLTFHLNLLITLKGYIITKIASSVIICRLCSVLNAAFQMACPCSFVINVVNWNRIKMSSGTYLKHFDEYILQGMLDFAHFLVRVLILWPSLKWLVQALLLWLRTSEMDLKDSLSSLLQKRNPL